MNYESEIFKENNEYPVILILQGGENANVLRHWHAEIEMNYTISGSIDAFFIEEDTFQTRTGDILYVNPFEVHGVQSKRKTLSELVLSVIIPTTFIDQFAPLMKRYFVTARKLNADDQRIYPQIVTELELLAKLAQEDQKDVNQLKVTAAVLKILTLYIEHFSVEKMKYNAVDERIYTLISYLHDHYTQSLTLSAIAEHFFLTESYLARYFKKRLGLTIFQYLDMIRGMHAVEELKISQKTVEEIAQRHGFIDAKALNKTLKKNYGQTAKYFKGQYMP